MSAADWPRPSQAALTIGLPALAFALLIAVSTSWGELSSPISHVKDSDWDYQLTLLEASARCWEAGALPGWNPWTAGGVPLLANPESPALHPSAIAAVWLHPALVIRLRMISALGLLAAAGVGMVRALGGGWLAAGVVLIGLGTSDVLLWRMSHGHMMMGQAAWIHGALLALLVIRRPALRGLAAGAAVALAALGGGPYPAWIALASCILWTLLGLLPARGVRAALAATLGAWMLLAGLDGAAWMGAGIGLSVGAVAWRFGGPPPLSTPSRRDGLIALGSAALFAALLGAPKWLTTAALLGETPRLRAALVPHASGDFSGLQALASVFTSPGFWDSGLWGSGLWERVPGLHEALPGLFSPLLLCLGLLGAWTLRRARPELACLALIAGALSFGHNLPVDLFALAHSLPPANRFQYPERWAFVWAPLLAVLAGLGAERIWRWRAAARPLLLAILAAHLLHAAPQAIARTQITQVTVDERQQAPLVAPSRVRGARHTNLESIGRNLSCLDCTDALLHRAPEALAEGAWSTHPTSRLKEWSPSAFSFVPARSGVHRLPMAWHPGWHATDAAGRPLTISPAEGVLTVQVEEPDELVSLRYRPPGLIAALALLGLGLLGGLAVLLRARADADDAESDRARDIVERP